MPLFIYVLFLDLQKETVAGTKHRMTKDTNEKVGKIFSPSLGTIGDKLTSCFTRHRTCTQYISTFMHTYL